jgi:hypothetical protein
MAEMTRASGYARAAEDWYVEDRAVVDALIKVERFVGYVWDPACGSGNIPKTFIAAGLTASGSDIADRGYGEQGVDFFTETVPDQNIVSNPPYGIIEPFLKHALLLTHEHQGKVAFLARLAFLEGKARQKMFRETPLARVWVSSRRVSMPPGGTDVPAKGGTTAYAWFVWDHTHSGAPTLDWLPL